MPSLDHSQAVEAAKQFIYYHGAAKGIRTTDPVIGALRDDAIYFARALLAAQLSAPPPSHEPPAPTGDPVTAEKCREFVGRLVNTAWHEFRHGEGYLSASELLRFEDELLAMFAGRTNLAPLKDALRVAMKSLGVKCAGNYEDARRWSVDDLLTDLMPLLEGVAILTEGKVCSRCLRPVDELLAMFAGGTGDGWLPIETAPKDGTAIDVFDPNCGRVNDVVLQIDGESLPDLNPTHWQPLPGIPFAGGTCDPTFCELQALKCVEHLEHIFHEDEPSPLMRPEEDDIIRDEVLLVCAVLKSKLPGITPTEPAK